MKKLIKAVALLVALGATSLFASEGAALYKSCIGCHGVNGEKKALGKSAAITGWEVEKTVAALQGYKDGTYGGAMKGVMKGQVTKLDEAKIKALAEHIATLK